MLPALSIAFFVFVMATSWLALILAELGRFSVTPCLLVGVFAGAGSFWIAFRSARAMGGTGLAVGPARTSNRLATAVAIAVACSTLISTHKAGELLSGGWDPGVYLHTGAQISRTGSLMNMDEDLLHITKDEEAILRRYQSGCVGPFAGMWFVPGRGTSPQFHHLYPALLGVAFSLGGVQAELLVNPLLNVACLIAFYALARRFIRAPFALAAVVALALNPAQIWQAKFCTAEMLGQFLLTGGAILFLMAMERDERSRIPPLLAGTAFGLAFLARYDSIMLIAPFVAMLIAAWMWLPNRRNAALVIAGMIPVVIHHVIRKPIFSPFYTPMGNIVGPALAALFILAAVFAAIMRNAKLRAFAEQRAGWLRILASAGVLVWVIFIWLRPHLGDLPVLTEDDAKNCYFIGAIFGPLVFAYFAALIIWLFVERDVVRAIWLYASVAVLLVVTTAIFNDHYLMWVSRRFIPVVVPLLVLALAVVLDRIAGATRTRHVIASVCLVVVTGINLPATFSMQRLRDWPGMADWTARVAAAIPDDARVFSDQWGFAAPLRFLYGKHAYELHLSQKDPDRRDRLLAVMNKSLQRGDKVYFLTLQGPLGLCEKRGTFPLNSQRLDSSTTLVPKTTRPAGGDFELYELRAP